MTITRYRDDLDGRWIETGERDGSDYEREGREMAEAAEERELMGIGRHNCFPETVQEQAEGGWWRAQYQNDLGSMTAAAMENYLRYANNDGPGEEMVSVQLFGATMQCPWYVAERIGCGHGPLREGDHPYDAKEIEAFRRELAHSKGVILSRVATPPVDDEELEIRQQSYVREQSDRLAAMPARARAKYLRVLFTDFETHLDTARAIQSRMNWLLQPGSVA